MPTIRRRFSTNRVRTGSASRIGRKSLIQGGLRSGGFRLTRAGVGTPYARFQAPTIRTPRVSVGGITISPRIKMMYFDRSIIKSNWKAINRTPVQRAANLVRIIARRSIRRRKSLNLHSPVGSPPYSHQETKTPPFKMIFNYPYNLAGTSQIVGMVGWSRPAIPGLHEHGGYARRRIRNLDRFRRPQPRTSQGRYRAYDEPKFNVRFARYPKRPFMLPALKTARPRITKFWVNSLSRAGYVGRFGAKPRSR